MSKQTFLVAVSGGIDSVVLLDMLRRSDSHLIVAHVDHGIREDSGADARFVEALAKGYGLPYVATQLALGADASEDIARQARYSFLYEKAREFRAEIVTAHHLDDMIGSIAINILRGTGWRGLAVMNRAGIRRPLLSWTKRQVYSYALEHRLEWVEDDTNQSDEYLRNRLRGDIMHLSTVVKTQLAELRSRERILARDIDQMCEQLLAQHAGSRYFYTMIDMVPAVELLRREIEMGADIRPTAAQAARALQAIKTGRAGSRHDVLGGVQLTLAATTFVVGSHLG